MVLRYGEETERLRNDLNIVVDRVGNGYKLCELGDRVSVDITDVLWSSRRK